MPSLKLTDAAIRRLKKPDTGRVEFWDTHTPGLGLRLSASGVASWVLITRALKAGAWKQQRVTLGAYPAMSLADARQTASAAKATAKVGEDPAAATRTARARMVDDSRNTFAAVRDEFLEKYRGRQNRRPAPNTLREMTRVLSAEAFGAWADAPLAKLTKRDVLDVLDGVVARGAETMANRTLAYLKLLFGWAAHRGIIEVDPTAGIKKPGHETSRDRVLSAAELRAIWEATGGDGLFDGIVRLLILTGARLNEVARLEWVELDADLTAWTLPAERSKNHRPHLVPVSAPARAILEARRETQRLLATNDKPAPPFVFTTNGTAPFSGFSKSKERLDAKLAKAGIEVAPWRLHDLRRSVATHMAETLRIPPHVIEAVLNHVSGSKAGVAGTYNRAAYLDERKAALNAWADYLARVTGAAQSDNVVELASARAG